MQASQSQSSHASSNYHVIHVGYSWAGSLHTWTLFICTQLPSHPWCNVQDLQRSWRTF